MPDDCGWSLWCDVQQNCCNISMAYFAFACQTFEQGCFVAARLDTTGAIDEHKLRLLQLSWTCQKCVTMLSTLLSLLHGCIMAATEPEIVGWAWCLISWMWITLSQGHTSTVTYSIILLPNLNFSKVTDPPLPLPPSIFIWRYPTHNNRKFQTRLNFAETISSTCGKWQSEGGDRGQGTLSVQCSEIQGNLL